MKRTVRLILVILAALLLAGCRSSRKAVREEAHTGETWSDSTREDSFRHESRTEARTATLSERAHASVRVTELSEPDSAGRQHPVRVTEIDYSRQREAATHETEAGEAQTVATRQTGKKGERQDGHRRETATVRRNSPRWRLYAALAILAVAIYYYYRKRRR